MQKYGKLQDNWHITAARKRSEAPYAELNETTQLRVYYKK